MSVVFPQPDLPGHQEGEDLWKCEDLHLQSRFRRYIALVQDFVNENTGLLFIVAAMVFFAMMDTAVIKLHKTDPPVTTLQVRLLSILDNLLAQKANFLR